MRCLEHVARRRVRLLYRSVIRLAGRGRPRREAASRNRQPEQARSVIRPSTFPFRGSPGCQDTRQKCGACHRPSTRVRAAVWTCGRDDRPRRRFDHERRRTTVTPQGGDVPVHATRSPYLATSTISLSEFDLNLTSASLSGIVTPPAGAPSRRSRCRPGSSTLYTTGRPDDLVPLDRPVDRHPRRGSRDLLVHEHRSRAVMQPYQFSSLRRDRSGTVMTQRLRPGRRSPNRSAFGPSARRRRGPRPLPRVRRARPPARAASNTAIPACTHRLATARAASRMHR